MSDLLPFVHGEEQTHFACRSQSEKYGGKVRCCGCTGHDCENDPDNFCSDKDCPVYVLGAVHKKGSPLCKYG